MTALRLEERASSLAVWRNAEIKPATSLGLLGGFELRVGGQVQPLPMTAQRLLVFLALHDRPLTRSFVSQCLWLEATEGHANGSLRVALCRIAKVEVGLIDRTGGHLALDPRAGVDFRHSAALARKLQSDPTSVDESELDEALLFRDLLPDWSDEWILSEQERYRQLRLHALEALSERLASLGRFGRAIQAGLAAVAGEPLAERANLVLVQAYLAEGNAGEAMRHYRSFETLLRDELGESPSQSFRRVLETLSERPGVR